MAYQGSVNAAAVSSLGLAPTTFTVMVTGGVLSGVYMLIEGTTGSLALASLAKAPWWAYTGGIVGPIITAAVAYAIGKAGMVNATTGIILGQLGSCVIDHMVVRR